MAETLEAARESIRPIQDGKVMDLVAEAGIDVTPWGWKKDGSPVKKPRANPSFCYEWAFGGGDEPTVLCVWHDSLQIGDGAIYYEDSLLDSASLLDPVAGDHRQDVKVRFRASSQAKRAHKFDFLLKDCFREGKAVRVLLLAGDRRARELAGHESSRVHFRALDPDQWFVHSYHDEDGFFRLVRGVPAGNGTGGFVDQFSLPEDPERRETSGWAHARSSSVRQAVLERAKGVCECCGCKGFEMMSGAVFLETHHVIPLAEGGPDEPWNVVAICPNDHRLAHYGAVRETVRDALIDRLIEHYPLAASALAAAHARMSG